ncbi:unnamed protein product, partial [Choristocarpus tenellus]
MGDGGAQEDVGVGDVSVKGLVKEVVGCEVEKVVPAETEARVMQWEDEEFKKQQGDAVVTTVGETEEGLSGQTGNTSVEGEDLSDEIGGALESNLGALERLSHVETGDGSGDGEDWKRSPLGFQGVQGEDKEDGSPLLEEKPLHGDDSGDQVGDRQSKSGGVELGQGGQQSAVPMVQDGVGEMGQKMGNEVVANWKEMMEGVAQEDRAASDKAFLPLEDLGDVRDQAPQMGSFHSKDKFGGRKEPTLPGGTVEGSTDVGEPSGDQDGDTNDRPCPKHVSADCVSVGCPGVTDIVGDEAENAECGMLCASGFNSTGSESNGTAVITSSVASSTVTAPDGAGDDSAGPVAPPQDFLVDPQNREENTGLPGTKEAVEPSLEVTMTSETVKSDTSAEVGGGGTRDSVLSPGNAGKVVLLLASGGYGVGKVEHEDLGEEVEERVENVLSSSSERWTEEADEGLNAHVNASDAVPNATESVSAMKATGGSTAAACRPPAFRCCCPCHRLPPQEHYVLPQSNAVTKASAEQVSTPPPPPPEKKGT